MISFDNMDTPNIIKICNAESIFFTFSLFTKQESMVQVVNIAKKFADRVIVIDNGSTDKMTEEAQNTGLKEISYTVNLGYGAVIASCLRSAIVTGSYFVEKNRGNGLRHDRNFGIVLLTKVTDFVTKITIMDATSGIRAHSSYVPKSPLTMPFSAGMRASSEILTGTFRNGLEIKEAHVNTQYVTIRRPLFLIGIPSLDILAIGVMSLLLLMDIYNNTKMITLGLGLLAVATSTICLAVLLFFIILYTLSNISDEALLQSKQMKNFNRIMMMTQNHEGSNKWCCG